MISTPDLPTRASGKRVSRAATETGRALSASGRAMFAACCWLAKLLRKRLLTRGCCYFVIIKRQQTSMTRGLLESAMSGLKATIAGSDRLIGRRQARNDRRPPAGEHARCYRREVGTVGLSCTRITMALPAPGGVLRSVVVRLPDGVYELHGK